MQGNYLTQTNQTFDPATGRVTAIQVAAGVTSVMNQAYTSNTVGNLTHRTDYHRISGVDHALYETFGYDDLNRLTSYTTQYDTGSVATTTVAYSATGNITSKSDVGTYTYPTQGATSVRPHAVSSITGTVNGSSNPSYVYDANGNQTSGAGRTLTWTAFNMPATITQGSNTLTFSYDTEHQRIKQAESAGTTVYINDISAGLKVEKFIGSGGATTWRNYIYAAGGMVAVFYDNSARPI